MQTRQIVGAGFLILGCLSGSVSAGAEEIQGELTEVNPGTQTFRIARSDPSNLSVEPESIRVQVGSNTELKGFLKLEELRKGDEVLADVEPGETAGTWSAKSVQIDKVRIRERHQPAVEAGAAIPGMEKI